MRRRIVIAAAATVAVLCVVIAASFWRMKDSDDIREGHAFGSDDGSYQIGMPTVMPGDDLWYIAPAITNRSSKKLTLEEVQPGTLPEGMTFIGSRLFRKDAFVAGVPLSWDTGSGDAYDPSSKPSTTVRGRTLLPGQGIPDDMVIYLHLKVTTGTRPIETNGVRFTYEQSGKKYAQVLNASLKLTAKAAPR